MSISKRAASALYNPDTPSALRAVVIYAAQNPGFEFGNYWTGDYKQSLRIYRQDSRPVTAAWQRIKVLARSCELAGVTDADILNACRYAFSGRLQVIPPYTRDGCMESNVYRVNYCAGQYFPTEYRNACAAVLQAALDECRARHEQAA